MTLDEDDGRPAEDALVEPMSKHLGIEISKPPAHVQLDPAPHVFFTRDTYVGNGARES